MIFRCVGRFVRFFLLASCLGVPAQAAERLGYHEVRTDASGKIVPWYGDDAKQAYDHVVRIVWITMRNGPNSVPYYLQH